MKIATFPGMFALRYPFFAPEDDAGAIDPAFVEQPGDREPEPGAPAGEDTQAAPAGEDTSSDTEGGSEGEDTQTSGEGEDNLGEGEQQEEPPARKTDWKDRQIKKARDEAKRLKDEKAAADRELERLRALVPEERRDEQAAPKTEAQIREDALKQVREEQRIERINSKADEMFEAGKKAFPKGWEERINQAADAIGQEMAARPDFLEALTDLPNAANVYYDLAGDPDRIEALLALPPHRMGIELGKLSTHLSTKAPKPVSKAPAPIKPLDKPQREERSLEDLINDPDASMDEIDRRMRAEEEKAYKRKMERGY